MIIWVVKLSWYVRGEGGGVILHRGRLIFHREMSGEYLGCVSGSSVFMPDYKTLCLAIMMWATMVNTQTHRQKQTDRHRQTDGFRTVIRIR